MARMRTTSDAFNAVADRGRRRILDLLARRERSVNDISRALRIRQPQVSKHLGVLRQVGLVRLRRSGRRRLYRVNAHGLKPVHDWVSEFERLMTESFDRLDEYLAEQQHEAKGRGGGQ